MDTIIEAIKEKIINLMSKEMDIADYAILDNELKSILHKALYIERYCRDRKIGGI